jgi:hypothetical protein
MVKKIGTGAICEVGFFSATGYSPCLKCPNGSLNEIKGSTSCQCKAGYLGYLGQAPCFKCPVNSFSRIGDQNCFSCIGYECTPGFDISTYGLPTRRPTRAPSIPTRAPSINIIKCIIFT